MFYVGMGALVLCLNLLMVFEDISLYTASVYGSVMECANFFSLLFIQLFCFARC